MNVDFLHIAYRHYTCCDVGLEYLNCNIPLSPTLQLRKHFDIARLADSRNLAQSRDIKFPISQLAPELLSLIFEEIRREELLAIGTIRLASPPVTAQVCQLWRNVSLSTPQLWSTIVLHCPTPFRLGPLLSLAKLYLVRSLKSPLNLVLGARFCCPQIHDFIHLSDPSRWESVHLHLPHFMYDEGCLKDLVKVNHFPLLRSLRFSLVYVDNRDDQRRVWSPGDVTLIEGAPKLQHLTISPGFDCIMMKFDVPFGKIDLRSYSGFLSGAQFTSLLRNSPNLESCKIDNYPQHGDACETALPFHNNLTSLYIPYLHEGITFIPGELPNLRRLGIGGILLSETFDVLAPLGRWGEQLETFVVDTAYNELIQALDLFPNIETLLISWLAETIVLTLLKRFQARRLSRLHTFVFRTTKIEDVASLLDGWLTMTPREHTRRKKRCYFRVTGEQPSEERLADLQKQFGSDVDLTHCHSDPWGQCFLFDAMVTGVQ